MRFHPHPLDVYVHHHGPEKVMGVVVEWWRENRHHGITLEDLGTDLQDWFTVLQVVLQVVGNPYHHPLRDDESVLDFIRYFAGVCYGV